MDRFRFPLAVAATSLALVAVLLGAGTLLIGNALASSPFMGAAVAAGGPWGGAPWAGAHNGWQLPPQLTGLADVPAGERFSHFRGVQVQLTDKDNNPLTVQVTPGTATSVTSSTLTIATNGGPSRTFALDDKTAIHAAARGQSNQSGAQAVTPNDHVLVVSLDNSATATAVIVATGDAFGPHGAVGR